MKTLELNCRNLVGGIRTIYIKSIDETEFTEVKLRPDTASFYQIKKAKKNYTKSLVFYTTDIDSNRIEFIETIRCASVLIKDNNGSFWFVEKMDIKEVQFENETGQGLYGIRTVLETTDCRMSKPLDYNPICEIVKIKTGNEI